MRPSPSGSAHCSKRVSIPSCEYRRVSEMNVKPSSWAKSRPGCRRSTASTKTASSVTSSISYNPPSAPTSISFPHAAPRCLRKKTALPGARSRSNLTAARSTRCRFRARSSRFSSARHDGDDPYLVVAGDKGTATFSDIANDIAREHGFWLDDAFASGGSAGYDHKRMGITARGAWESVKRHFREMDVDLSLTPFSVIGVGDMSGDVFGNGMLRERTIRLVAAFDHRDIFIDPTPDPERSFEERRRLFDLPRSSWRDFDQSIISRGGGACSRTAKEIH